MGAGIAYQSALRGVPVTEGCLREGARVRPVRGEEAPRQAGRAGQDDREQADAGPLRRSSPTLTFDQFNAVDVELSSRRLLRTLSIKMVVFREDPTDRRRQDNSRLQHLILADSRSRRRTGAPAEFHRHANFQPRAQNGAG